MYRIRNKLGENIVQINGVETEVPMADVLELYGVFCDIPDEVTVESIYNQVVEFQNIYPVLFVEKIELWEYAGMTNQALHNLYLRFKSVDLTTLLRFYLPNLVCEVEETVSLLDRVASKMMSKVYHIIAMKQLFLRAENMTTKLMKDELYDYYSKKGLPELVLDRDAMWALYQSVNFYSLDFGFHKIPKSAVTAVRILEELRESQDNQLKHALEIYRMRKPDIDRMIEVNQEVRERYPETRALTQQDIKKAFLKVISNMKKVSPLEFLAAEITNRNANDVALENGIFYQKCTQDINTRGKNRRILLVNPPPLFLLKWLEDEAIDNMGCTILCMDVLEYEIVKVHLAAVKKDKIEVVLFKHWMKRYTGKGTKPSYSNAIIFSMRTHIKDECELWEIMQSHFKETGCSVWELFSSADLELARRPFTRSWEQDESIQVPKVMTLPQDILCAAEPRRKIIMWIIIDEFDTVGFGNRTLLWKYRLYREQSRQLLCQYSTDMKQIEKEIFVNTESIREIYDIVSKLGGTLREEPKCFPFTVELKIWHTLYYPNGEMEPPRVEAYFAPLADVKHVARRKLKRDKRLENTVKRTTKLWEADIEHWIEHVYPFETIMARGSSAGGKTSKKKIVRNVRDEVIASCGAMFENKPISLKLLWYLYPEISKIMDESDYELFSQLACSELGAFNLGTAKAEDYDQYIRFSTEEGTGATGHQLMVLSCGLDFALKHGHCYQNVLLTLVDTRMEEERDRLPEIRKALAKKSFTPLEMRGICEFAASKIERESGIEYLGVLIRLMTGLEANIVSGLCWDDIQSVADYGFEQILVCRQVVNNGSDYAGFVKEYSYRAIPCPLELSRHIDIQRKLVLKKTPGLTKEQRGVLPVVTTIANLSDVENRYQIFSPIDLEKISKYAIQAVGIPDQVIQVPSKKKGVIETNLSRYQGDIFRSNFRFYGLQLARLEAGELAYLIGNKPDTTFECYYFDYTNQAEQYAMWVKLTGWCSGIFQREMRYMERSVVHDSFLAKTVQPSGTFSAGTEIYLTSENRDIVEVELGSRHGLEGMILREKSSESMKAGV